MGSWCVSVSFSILYLVLLNRVDRMRLSLAVLVSTVYLVNAGIFKGLGQDIEGGLVNSFGDIGKKFKDFGKKELKWIDEKANQKLKKFSSFTKDEECQVIWEEHKQPHCSTEYDEQCTEEHVQQCKTEYENQCSTEYQNQCSTEYTTSCEQEYTQECQQWRRRSVTLLRRGSARLTITKSAPPP